MHPPLERITVYPPLTWPRPTVRAIEIERIDDCWLRYWETGEDAEVPDDAIFFDIADADPTNIDSMFALAKTLRAAPIPRRNRWRDVQPEFTARRASAAYTKHVNDFAIRCGLSVVEKGELPENPMDERERTTIHIAEISLRVDLAQKSVALIGEELPPYNPSDPHHGRTGAERGIATYLGLWGRMLDGFQLTFEYNATTEESMHGFKRHSAFAVAYLDLFNAFNSEAGIKRCQHCGRVFSHQVAQSRPDSTPTYRRKNSIYCSPKCASAAAVKQFRARKRDETQP